MQRNKMLTRACIFAILAACGSFAVAAQSKGPGGRSRVFHVDCGAFAPGNPQWKAEYDDAIVGDGYGYSVAGSAYQGGGPAAYCWFFTERGSATIRCPKGVEGTLYLKFVDLSNNHRKQTVTVCGRYTDAIERFYEPAGKWFQYKLTKQDTAQRKISIEFVNTGGSNAVISRIDFVPAGVKDALLPDRVAGQMTPQRAVEHDWYRQERLKHRPPGSRAAVAEVLQRGEALLKDLVDLGAGEIVSQAAEKLAACRRRHDELADREEAGGDVAAEWDKLYLQTRWIVRRAALNNPLLNFDELLFVKRFTPSVGHQCSHHVGSSQIPGADLCVLNGLKPDGEVRSVLGDLLPPGAIARPDLSFDAERIVFPYAAPRPEPTAYPYGQPGQVGGACLDYQLYEISVTGSDNVDGAGLRKLTSGPHENTEPCYLPDGRICFTSSRCKTFVQCGDWAIVFSLFAMRADGSDVRPITLAKEGEWWPGVLDDGRIVYMRWEYVLKPFNTIQYLWTVHPDGTKASLAYGDHFAFSPGPLTFIEPRQIPGTSKLIATGAAHHNCGVGPICIVDMRRNRGDAAGLLRVTPEVGYPETSDMAAHNPALAGWYNAPYPLSEKHYLACYSFDAAHNSPIGYGIYLMDVHGNKELIYRDPQRSCYSPIPLRPRRKPPVLAHATRDNAKPASGTVLMLDVYEGLEGVPRGTIKHLRVLETICKTEHSVPQRLDVGIGSGWDPRRILGTVPVADDGSACFEVPAGVPVFFEALDENYMDVRRMRSYMNVQPGEKVTCVGCHESYATAPPNRPVAALRQPPVKIAPPPWGPIAMDFGRVVQPVLDRRCVQCHDGGQAQRHSFDLTANLAVPAKGADNHFPPAPRDPYRVTAAYVNLLKYVDFTRLSGYGGGNLPLAPYAVGSHRSKLVKILDAGHYDVQLTPAERRAIVAWIDCNAPYLGGWDDYLVAKTAGKPAR